METKTRFVMKHKYTGIYFSDTPEKTTQKLFNAKRFPSEEYYLLWLEVSPHKPDKPEDYALIPITLTIEEAEQNGSTGNHEEITGTISA